MTPTKTRPLAIMCALWAGLASTNLAAAEIDAAAPSANAPQPPAPEQAPADPAALIDKPLPALTPEEQRQADQLVGEIKQRAIADAEREPPPVNDANAVRVTHVPEVIKQELREQVKTELHDQLVQDIFAQARNEQWGLPQALPGWVNHFSMKGDMRLRGQADVFDAPNVVCSFTSGYIDFATVNAKGGFNKAGLDGCLNTTEDRQRLRTRARLGIDAKVNNTLKASMRLSTGNTRDPVSTNQTLGNYGGRYTVVWDEAYLRYDGENLDRFPWLTLVGGRAPNPWLSTDLIWDTDLAFEGLAGTMRYNLRGSDSLLEMTERDRILFFTLGAFPLQEFELAKRDKWLYGAQLGTDLVFHSQSKLRIAMAYYHYENITGVRNAADTTYTDYTAPAYIQKGNGMFDIRNDLDVNTDFWALAADYKLANLTIQYDSLALAPHHVITTFDAVKNVGYDKNQIRKRTNGLVEHAGGRLLGEDPLRERTLGYQLNVSYGWPIVSEPRTWRVFATYRYLERDAVLDAFTDSDFHLGGTDAKGYIIGGDYAIAEAAWITLKYLSSDAIDGAPLSIDTLQIDLNAKF